MRKRIALIYTGRGECRHRNTALFLVSAAFLIGGVLGCMTYEKYPGTSVVQLFLSQSVYSTTILQELWTVFRWPAGLLILQLFPLVGLSVPIAMSLRGFLLSYSISAFTNESILSAVLLFGPRSVLTLPILFLLSTEILLRKAGEQAEYNPAVILACLLSLILSIVIDLTVVPMLYM